MIKAVTFDLWDTVIHDDSDEPKRAAQGLKSKKETRRQLMWEALQNEAPITQEEVWLACDTTDAAFNHVWHDQFVTWTVPERLKIVLAGLGRTLPNPVLENVIRQYEEMEVMVAPDMIDGVAEAIAELAEDFPLAVVSDTIVSPGRCLRQWLEMNGILDHFAGFAFSDEVGHSKPHADMFAWAAGEMGVTVNEMVHVGDRDHNDIKGAQALGMKAILFTGTRDTDRDITSADAICSHHCELPGIVRQLAGIGG